MQQPASAQDAPGHSDVAAGGTSLDDTFGIEPSIYQRRWAILAVLCVSLVVIVIAVSSLNVALPTMIRALGASSTQTLWIVESYALVFAVGLLPAGALGDRFGRKRALTIGLVIFGTMAAIAAFAQSPTQVIIARALMGIGAALIMPATLSIITNVFPPQERQKAIATWAGLAGAGGALGPLLSGLVLRGGFWWGAVFLVNIPLVVLLLAMVTFTVPESKDPGGHALDPIGALLSIAFLASLVFGIIEGPEWGWTSAGVLGAFALSIVAGTAFVRYELGAKQPMLDPRLFKLRGLSTGSMTIGIAFFTMFGLFFLTSQYLQFVHGYSALETGVRTLPSAAMMILVSPRSPQIVQRLGVRTTIRVGFSLIALAFVGLSTLTAQSAYWPLAGFLVMTATGMAMVMAPASGMIVSSLPLTKAGVGSALNDVTREVGGAIGIAVMGTVVTSLYGPKMAELTASAPVPANVRPVIEDSIGAAFGVAEQVNATAGPQAAQMLRQSASDAFISGMHGAYLLAAGLAALAAIVIAQLTPEVAPTMPGVIATEPDQPGVGVES